MSAKASGINFKDRRNRQVPPYWALPLLDVVAITAWGVLLLKYWLTGSLNLLIHPNYFWLVVVTGVLLLIVGVIKGMQLFWTIRQRSFVSGRSRRVNQPVSAVQ